MKPSNYTSYPIMHMTMKPLTHNIYICIAMHTQSGTRYFCYAYYGQSHHSKGPYLGTFISMHKWVFSYLPFQVYMYSTLDNYFIVYLGWVINIVKHGNYTKQYCVLLCKMNKIYNTAKPFPVYAATNWLKASCKVQHIAT